jgi:hypothetical protein
MFLIFCVEIGWGWQFLLLPHLIQLLFKLHQLLSEAGVWVHEMAALADDA